MGCEVFEIGLLPESADTERSMLPRVLDGNALLRSLRCLRYENRRGRNISIVQTGSTIESRRRPFARSCCLDEEGRFNAAVGIETSPRKYQPWLKHPEQLNRELSTAVARSLTGLMEIDGQPTGGTPAVNS